MGKTGEVIFPGIYTNLFNLYNLGKLDLKLAFVYKSSGYKLNSVLLVWRKSIEMNIPSVGSERQTRPGHREG